MEKMKIFCPRCGNALSIPLKLNISKVRCKCGEIVGIPEVAKEELQTAPTIEKIDLPCPFCGEVLELEGVNPGENIECPKCSKTFVVPNPDDEALQANQSSSEAASGNRKTSLIFGVIVAVAALVSGVLYFTTKKTAQPARPDAVNVAPAPAAPVQVMQGQIVPHPAVKEEVVQVPAPPSHDTPPKEVRKPASSAPKKARQDVAPSFKPPSPLLVGRWSVASNKGKASAQVDIRKDGIVIWDDLKGGQEAKFCTQLDNTSFLISSKKGVKTGKGWIIVHLPIVDGVVRCDDSNAATNSITLQKLKP